MLYNYLRHAKTLQKFYDPKPRSPSTKKKRNTISFLRLNNMEFLLFLNAKEKQILNLIYETGFKVEENTPLCLLGKKYFGFTKRAQKTIVICTRNAMEFGGYFMPKVTRGNNYDQTGIQIRRALRHEAVHVAQSCNKGKPLNIINDKKLKIHPYKYEALRSSTEISGSNAKEYEAYAMEDKPKIVISALKKYCL